MQIRHILIKDHTSV